HPGWQKGRYERLFGVRPALLPMEQAGSQGVAKPPWPKHARHAMPHEQARYGVVVHSQVLHEPSGPQRYPAKVQLQILKKILALFLNPSQALARS
ncbi:MAG: hypothetical protein QXI12_05395, partial [Candidatus Methanomethyliaceae archaeon]